MYRIIRAYAAPEWTRFYRQWRADASLWTFSVLFLAVLRAVFIFRFRDRIEIPDAAGAVALAMFQGFRFDAMVATYALLPSLMISMACGLYPLERIAQRVRQVTGVLFTGFSIFIYIVASEYFREYNDLFNHFLFGLVYDDTKAIFITIWKEYNVVPNLLAGVIIFAVSYPLPRYFMRLRVIPRSIISWPEDRSPAVKILFTLVILALIAFGVRGSFGIRVAQARDAAVTEDAFLNKTVMNPFVSLKYALKRHRELMKGNGLKVFLPGGDVRGALKRYFSTSKDYATIDQYLHRTANGPAAGVVSPRHIFLVVMESYDTWPMLDEYRALSLAPQVKALGAKGLMLLDFLPASTGTMSSLATILTGMPDAGVQTNYQATASSPFPSSLATTFERLGYTTRFFYGGYLSWQKIDEFLHDQGFREIYGAPHIQQRAQTNEWGVDDRDLFNFVLQKVDPGKPSLNVILTTTYHPPYDIDLEKEGFPLTEIPPDIQKIFDNKSTDLNMLGHLWYSDKVVGEFVHKMDARADGPSLFVLTGDHSGRKHIKANPGVFESSTVPLVLYGPGSIGRIKSFPPGMAGSHIDIMPTLVEISAPRGFEYYSLGNDLFHDRSGVLGIASHAVIGNTFIAAMGRTPSLSPLPWPELRGEVPAEARDLSGIKHRYDDLHGIGWWRVMKGNELPPAGRSGGSS